MEYEMERGDGGKVGERESQRAARREDVGETKRRKKMLVVGRDGREGNKGEVERDLENRKMNERVKELWETETFHPRTLRA